MQEVSGSIPLFSTKKALYFVGSTVLFFLLKLVFGGCIASPAPFLGFCRRFLYNPQLLTLRFIHHPEVTARCSVRTVHIQGAMHPIYYFCILQYVKESLENTSFAGNHQMPRNVKVNSTGLVTSGIYSGWTLAPQLSSPPTPICSPIARMTV